MSYWPDDVPNLVGEDLFVALLARFDRLSPVPYPDTDNPVCDPRGLDSPRSGAVSLPASFRSPALTIVCIERSRLVLELGKPPAWNGEAGAGAVDDRLGRSCCCSLSK